MQSNQINLSSSTFIRRGQLKKNPNLQTMENLVGLLTGKSSAKTKTWAIKQILKGDIKKQATEIVNALKDKCQWVQGEENNKGVSLLKDLIVAALDAPGSRKVDVVDAFKFETHVSELMWAVAQQFDDAGQLYGTLKKVAPYYANVCGFGNLDKSIDVLSKHPGFGTYLVFNFLDGVKCQERKGGSPFDPVVYKVDNIDKQVGLVQKLVTEGNERHLEVMIDCLLSKTPATQKWIAAFSEIFKVAYKKAVQDGNQALVQKFDQFSYIGKNGFTLTGIYKGSKAKILGYVTEGNSVNHNNRKEGNLFKIEEKVPEFESDCDSEQGGNSNNPENEGVGDWNWQQWDQFVDQNYPEAFNPGTSKGPKKESNFKNSDESMEGQFAFNTVPLGVDKIIENLDELVDSRHESENVTETGDNFLNSHEREVYLKGELNQSQKSELEGESSVEKKIETNQPEKPKGENYFVPTPKSYRSKESFKTVEEVFEYFGTKPEELPKSRQLELAQLETVCVVFPKKRKKKPVFDSEAHISLVYDYLCEISPNFGRVLFLMQCFSPKDLEVEGIFRIPGNNNKLEWAEKQFFTPSDGLSTDIIKQFKKQELWKAGNTGDHPVHLKAKLLQRAVGRIPGGVIPQDSRELAFGLLGQKNNLKDFIQSLPRINQVFLVELLEFLQDVVKNAKTNKINLKNVAMLFGQKLLPLPGKIANEKIAMWSLQANQVVEVLLENTGQIRNLVFPNKK